MRKIRNEFVESLRYLRRNLEEMAHHLHQLDEKAEETKISVERVREFLVDAQYDRFVNMYEGTMAKFLQVRHDMDEYATYCRMTVEIVEHKLKELEAKYRFTEET